MDLQARSLPVPQHVLDGDLIPPIPATSQKLVPLYSPTAVALWLGVSNDQLRKWREAGKGPSAIVMDDRTIRYREDDLIDWVERNRRVA